jgi:hypothetical protein
MIPKILPDVRLLFIEISTRFKSRVEFILGIIVRLVKIITWVVKIIISFENLTRVIKLFYFIHSRYMPDVIQTVVDY